jgi:hypothetical protein
VRDGARSATHAISTCRWCPDGALDDMEAMEEQLWKTHKSSSSSNRVRVAPRSAPHGIQHTRKMTVSSVLYDTRDSVSGADGRHGKTTKSASGHPHEVR